MLSCSWSILISKWFVLIGLKRLNQEVMSFSWSKIIQFFIPGFLILWTGLCRFWVLTKILPKKETFLNKTCGKLNHYDWKTKTKKKNWKEWSRWPWGFLIMRILCYALYFYLFSIWLAYGCTSFLLYNHSQNIWD